MITHGAVDDNKICIMTTHGLQCRYAIFDVSVVVSHNTTSNSGLYHAG